MFNIDWSRFVGFKTPYFWRWPVRLAWLYVLAFPARKIFGRFFAFKAEIDYLNHYNSQIIYLEKRLNDKWDPVNRGIYIDNLADLDRFYIYNKIEAKPTTYTYNKWKTGTLYLPGYQVVHKRKVYRALFPSAGQAPDVFTASWLFEKDVPVVRNKVEFDLQNDFIVYVPVAVIFDINEMKATINLYKFASLKYQIITY